MASRQLLIFKLNNIDFGVDISLIDSIITPKETVKLPNTPDFIEGLLSLRGKVYTIFNLRKKFNFPTQEITDSTKIVIVSVNSMMIGFITDEVSEIIRVENEDIETDSQTMVNLNKKYLSGIAKLGEKIILILELSQTLSLVDDIIPEKVVKVKTK